MSEIIQWVSVIRDVGLILGIPILITVGIKLYSQQIEILKARNELLKETQYDRAVSLLESQKKAFLLEREALEMRIADLERLEDERAGEIARVKQVVEKIDSVLARTTHTLNESLSNTKHIAHERGKDIAEGGR